MVAVEMGDDQRVDLVGDVAGGFDGGDQVAGAGPSSCTAPSSSVLTSKSPSWKR
jgi:hypothetical protein